MYHFDPTTQTAFAREHAEQLRKTMLASRRRPEIGADRPQPVHSDVESCLHQCTAVRRAIA